MRPMLIGILSDSHGDAAATARAVRRLVERGAVRLIHCGDLCGEGVLAELAGRDATFVWGNCDDPTPALRRCVAALGLTWPDGPQRLLLAGRRLGVYHGHEPDFTDAARDGGLDYLLHGHTHRCADRRVGSCRVINPGALYRAKLHTAALLDLATDALEFIAIDTGAPVVVAPS